MKAIVVRSVYSKTKALLCIALILNLHYWMGGCGSTEDNVSSLGQLLRIELTPDHPLANALGQGALSSAKALEIDPASRTFRFIFTDATQQLEGRYASAAGGFAIQELSLGRVGRSITLTFDLAKHVEMMRTNDGQVWQRPSDWPSTAPTTEGLQAYIDANPELLRLAGEADLARGITPATGAIPGAAGQDDPIGATPVGGKNDAALIGALPLIFVVVALIWGEVVGATGGLLGIFLVMALVQGLLAGVEPPPTNPVPDSGDEGPPGSQTPGITDCNDNGVEDATDIAEGDSKDCNANGIPDGCEIADQSVDDCDADGVPDGCQSDGDEDGLIDACDACSKDADNDVDGDGVCGDLDNCPITANATQGDADNDGAGNECDACPNDADDDIDGDGICGDVDNCPDTNNPNQEDADSDGFGDACDACANDPDNDLDGDGICGDVDNCPGDANPGQENADEDDLGDACDTQGCCLPNDNCTDVLEVVCLASGGTPQGPGTNCATVVCDPEILVIVQADRAWVYENLSGITDCPVNFTATIVNDPLNNTTGYTFSWTIEPPTDRSNPVFTEVPTDNTDQVTFTRPSFSPSGLPYGATVQVTGIEFGNQGAATVMFDVRILGDVNGDFCVDSNDDQMVKDVEDGIITDPATVDAADVNCDGSVDGLDRQIILVISKNADGFGACFD